MLMQNFGINYLNAERNVKNAAFTLVYTLLHYEVMLTLIGINSTHLHEVNFYSVLWHRFCFVVNYVA